MRVSREEAFVLERAGPPTVSHKDTGFKKPRMTTCLPASAIDPLDALPVTLLEQHVSGACAASVSRQRDYPHHTLENLVSQERITFEPIQYLDAAHRQAKKRAHAFKC